MPTRLPSSIDQVDRGVLGARCRASLATSASVLPVSGFSVGFLKPTSSMPSRPRAEQKQVLPVLGMASRISASTLARVAGSCSRAIQASSPPACTQVGMAASRPVAPAV